jgi:hypothetical protein
MSNTQKLAFAVAVVASALTGAAQTVEIKISGSTAFRNTAQNAIEGLYTSSGGSSTRTGSIGANQVTWTGTIPTLYGSSTVIIKTSFSGSVEGIVNLLGAPNPPGVTQPAYLNPGFPSSNFDTATGADVIFSDVVQETTDYAPPTWTALDGNVVGVVTFGWFRGLSTSASTLSNITGQQASALIPNGTIAKSLFTGVTSDASTPVYLLGRNALSGTRLITQADCGWGANSSAISYYPTNISGTISIVQDVAATPGYSSGSGLRTGLGSSTTAALIGYMSINDGATIISRNLSYNGVSGNPSGTFKDDVRNGRYSLWSYQNVFYKPNLSDSKKTLFRGTTAPQNPLTSNGLIKAIDTTLATDFGNIQLSTMNVSRPSDGASITP